MLYKAKNKNSKYMWIIANDYHHASLIALENKFVKHEKNLRLMTMHDENTSFYDFFKNQGNDMSDVDNKTGVGGVIVGKFPKPTWIVK